MEKRIRFMSFPIENIKSCSSLEHGPKGDKSASAFLKLCFHVCLKVLKKFYRIKPYVGTTVATPSVN